MAGNLKDAIIQQIARQEVTKFLKRIANSKEAKMLTGYKTYIIAVLLLIIAALKFMGIEIPGVSDNSDPGALITVALGLVFSRNGAKTEVRNIE